MRYALSLVLLLAAPVALMGCDATRDDDAGSVGVDAGAAGDGGGAPLDAGSLMDAAAPDAAVADDAGSIDVGATDSGADAGPVDAGPTDAAVLTPEEVCDPSCRRLQICTGAPDSALAECITDCIADISDCSPSERETLRGCERAPDACEVDPATMVPKMLQCITAVPCVMG